MTGTAKLLDGALASILQNVWACPGLKARSAGGEFALAAGPVSGRVREESQGAEGLAVEARQVFFRLSRRGSMSPAPRRTRRSGPPARWMNNLPSCLNPR